MKFCMFRTISLSVFRSFSLYTQQWYTSYRFVDSFRAGSGWNADPSRILIYQCHVIHAITESMNKRTHEAKGVIEMIIRCYSLILNFQCRGSSHFVITILSLFPKYIFKPYSYLKIQGGSNMTGTVYTCLHTNQSRSYLNHPVSTAT